MRRLVGLGFVLALVTAACGGNEISAPSPTFAVTSTSATPTAEAAERTPWPTQLSGEHQDWAIRVIERLPHDSTAFTQGLEMTDAGLIEGTGRRGKSTLRVVERDTGAVILKREIDVQYFGEGITQHSNELIQLTWEAGVLLRYDAVTLEPVAASTYDGEGWGICSGEVGLWMSNGTAELTRRDAVTFDPLQTVTVHRGGDAIDKLNELECIGNHVVANVWKSNEILVIDPLSGKVVATVDASELADEVQAGDNHTG